jgi:hypothetical protein
MGDTNQDNKSVSVYRYRPHANTLDAGLYSCLQALLKHLHLSIRIYPSALVRRMFVPADRAIALGIYCSYCILRRRILTELIFGGHDTQQSAATADPSSQGLAGQRSVGGTPCDGTGPLRHCIRARLGRRLHRG